VAENARSLSYQSSSCLSTIGVDVAGRAANAVSTAGICVEERSRRSCDVREYRRLLKVDRPKSCEIHQGSGTPERVDHREEMG
jgi:hypothetical protein